MDEEGEESGLEAGGGSSNVWRMGGALGGRSGAGCSLPGPRDGRARMIGGCPAGSDRPTARTWTAAMEAVCSTSPSRAALLSGGDGVM